MNSVSILYNIIFIVSKFMVFLSIFRTCEDRRIHDNSRCLAVPSYR